MILEFLPHRACDSILPTLMSVSLQSIPSHVSATDPEQYVELPHAQANHPKLGDVIQGCIQLFCHMPDVLDTCARRRRQMPRRT